MENTLTQTAPPQETLQIGAPGTNTDAAVICQACKQQNSAQRRFCAGCGRNLWEKCPKCGAEHVDGELFCGRCGTDLQQVYRDLEKRHQATLDRSEELADRHEFDAAICEVRSLLRLEGGRFDQSAARAKQLIEEYRARKKRANEAAEEALQTAHRHSARYDYEQALAVLEAIPEPSRDDAFGHLLKEVRSKRDLVRTLTAEIRSDVQSGQLMGLTVKLERFLDLKPKDKQMIRLAGQLRDRFVRTARKKIDVEDYSTAVRLLDEVPTCALDADVQKLAEEARELDWLMSNMKQAAVVDATLLALAERLVNLRPKNEKAARLYAKLRSRADAAAADTLHAAPDWAVSQKAHLGCPVDWLAGLQQISCTREVTSQLQAHPGRFFAACGLALQGLDRAAVGINLLSREPQRGVLATMRLRRKKPARAAWGLDLGSSALKAVHMRQTDSRGVVEVDACELFEYPLQDQPLDIVTDRRPQWTGALAKFVSDNTVEGDRICIGLPGSFVLGRFFDLPPVEKKSIENVVRYEAAGQIPFPLEDLNWGYQVLESPGDEEGEFQERRIVLQAVKCIHIQELLDIGREVGLTVDIVQSDCAALHNFAVHEYLNEADSSAGAVCMLDVGAVNSNLVISFRDRVWFRSLGIAGEAFTTALLRPLMLTRARAEQLKCNLSMAKRVSPVYELLSPVMSRLVDEVQRSLQVRSQVHPDLPVRRLIGAGGGFALYGLLRHFRSSH